jgi:hypothetical protein
MSHSINPADAELRDFLDQTGPLLEEAFGETFDFWLSEQSWTRLTRASRSPVQEISPHFLAAADLARAIRTGEPLLHHRAGGHWWIGVPLEYRPGKVVLATAVMPGTSAELLTRLGRLFLKQLDLRRRWERTVAACEDSRPPVDEGESMAFLRRAIDLLEIADITCGTWHLARAVLPLLPPLVQAETLALVPDPEYDRETSANRPAPIVHACPRALGAEICEALVERYSEYSPGPPVLDGRVDRHPDAALFPGVRQILLVPILHGGRAMAWLLAVNRAGSETTAEDSPGLTVKRDFGSLEAGLMSAVAAMLAAHTRNHEAFRQRESLLVDLVRSMVSAIDAKDPYTRGHSERVALVARRLAEELAMTPTECERIYLTGLLHDLGKIGVDDAILHKPAKLSDEERAAIMRHPAQGWAILQDLPQLQGELPGVLHHHENYDGTGYPDHLAGQEIPLPARVVAVADSFDAMSSDRPYRRAMPLDRVLGILRGGSGTQWDPQIIDALFHALPAIRSLVSREATPSSHWEQGTRQSLA